VNIKRELGIIGLGIIGGNLARQALEKDLRVVGYRRSRISEEMKAAGLVAAKELDEVPAVLQPPRVIFLYVPAGTAVDQVIEGLVQKLEPGDVLIDGGNSYWGDSVRRYKQLKERGVHFVDLGTSGGAPGARHGACFMAGGEEAALERIEPILCELAVEGGYVRAGGPGAGHFVKLVHNGIEFGMLQAIGEGVSLLERYHEKLPLADVLRCWRNGSVIRSWLIDLMEESYRSEGGTENIPPYVEDTGEVNWLVMDAMQMEVPVPVIAQSIMQLFTSRDDQQHWARAVAMMRHGFGEHPYGPDESIAVKRKTSRVGEIYRES
jgi:6-phosphogluconate dehydrogenase